MKSFCKDFSWGFELSFGFGFRALGLRPCVGFFGLGLWGFVVLAILDISTRRQPCSRFCIRGFLRVYEGFRVSDLWFRVEVQEPDSRIESF